MCSTTILQVVKREVEAEREREREGERESSRACMCERFIRTVNSDLIQDCKSTVGNLAADITELFDQLSCALRLEVQLCDPKKFETLEKVLFHDRFQIDFPTLRPRTEEPVEGI